MRSALVAIAAVACSTPRAPVTTPDSAILRPRLVAHRGASQQAPENTLAAFRAAWALGVEAVELDVRVSADGAVVVIHDASTARVAGIDRLVNEQTLTQLRELDVGQWRDARFAGERIPTLAEVIATVPAGATLVVELKTTIADVPAVAAVLRAAPRAAGSRLALQAFDAEALAALAAAVPDADAYWTLGAPRDDADRIVPYPLAVLDAAQARGFAGLALDTRAISDEFVTVARERGVLLDVWTVNDPTELAAWLARDVRFVETDRPELVPTRGATSRR